MSEEKLKEYLKTLSKDRVIELCLQYKFDAEIAEQQLKETKDEIDLYKKFVSGGTIDEVIDAVWRKREIDKLKQQLAEKDKEIEHLKDGLNMCQSIKRYDVGEMLTENTKLKQHQTQLAIEELEKVKVNLKDRISMMKNEEHSYLQKVVAWYDICDQINKQIKELKGE